MSSRIRISLLALLLAFGGGLDAPSTAAADAHDGAAARAVAQALAARTGTSRHARGRCRRGAKRHRRCKARKHRHHPRKTASPTGSASPEPTNPTTSSIAPSATVTPMPSGLPLFKSTSVWNQPLADDAPLDPSSSQLSDSLATEVQNEMADKTGPWINTDEWSVPVYTVGQDVSSVHVTLDNVDTTLQDDFDSVPIPDGAHAAAGTDESLVIYQPSDDRMWEFWGAYQGSDGWHARWGGEMTGVSSSPGYFPSPYGASATSLPLLGGLIKINELQSGEIDHALAIAIPNTEANAFTWPAQRDDGSDSGTNAIPEGTHFRIDPSVDLSSLGLSPAGLAIARAAQRYGMIVRDTASNFTFYGEDPTTINGPDPYPQIFQGAYPNQVLEGFPWDHLEVVAPAGG